MLFEPLQNMQRLRFVVVARKSAITRLPLVQNQQSPADEKGKVCFLYNVMNCFVMYYYFVPIKSLSGLILERYVLIPCLSLGKVEKGISLWLSK